MSRGLGRIDRPILGMIQDKDVCEERYTAVDLARDLSEATAEPGRARCGPSSDAPLGAQISGSLRAELRRRSRSSPA